VTAVCPASSNRPCLDEGFFNYSILRLVWYATPHFLRAGVPQDQSLEASEGMGAGDLVCAAVCAAGVGARLTFKLHPRHLVGDRRLLRAYGEVGAHLGPVIWEPNPNLPLILGARGNYPRQS
jgi:hypothetical protein